MRTVILSIFIGMYIAFASPCWMHVQDPTPTTPSAQKELSPEQFFEAFLAAAQENNTAQVQQLVKKNPLIAEQAQKRRNNHSQQTSARQSEVAAKHPENRNH